MADLNRATTIDDKDLDDVFEYHPWDEVQQTLGKRVRESLKAAFKTIIESVPPCPDRTVALRKLRDVRMDCNSALTHRGKY